MSSRPRILRFGRLRHANRIAWLWATCVALALPANLCCGLPGLGGRCCQAESDEAARTTAPASDSVPRAGSCCSGHLADEAFSTACEPVARRVAGHERAGVDGGRGGCCCVLGRGTPVSPRLVVSTDSSDQDLVSAAYDAGVPPVVSDRSAVAGREVPASPRARQSLLCRWRC